MTTAEAMQNAPGHCGRAGSSRVSLLSRFVLIVAAPASAQMTGAPTAGYKQEPGMTVVGGAGAAAGDRLRPEPRPTRAARHAVQGRSGPRRARSATTSARGRSCCVFAYYDCPMLCTHGHQRARERARRALARARQGFRDRHRQLRSARHAGDRRREEGRLHRALQAAGRRGRLALPDRRAAVHRPADARPPASATCGTRTRSSSRTRRASSCSRPTGGSPGICSASNTARAICGSRSSRRRTARSARRSIRCCSTAITTTR